jgi:FkbM family methyltransferase
VNFFRSIRNLFFYIHEFGVYCALSIAVQRRLGRRVLRIRPKGITNSLIVRESDSDFATLRSVIGKKEVWFPLKRSPAVIVDAGANVGYSAIAFANRWPHARIFALEPDGESFEVLQENAAPYPKITCIRSAVWGISQPLTSLTPSSLSWARQFGTPDNDDQLSECDVEGLTITELMARLELAGIDLLKVDIEGAEIEVFSGKDMTWLRQVDVIAIELHDRFRPNCRDVVETALRGWSQSVCGEYDMFVRNGVETSLDSTGTDSLGRATTDSHQIDIG